MKSIIFESSRDSVEKNSLSLKPITIIKFNKVKLVRIPDCRTIRSVIFCFSNLNKIENNKLNEFFILFLNDQANFHETNTDNSALTLIICTLIVKNHTECILMRKLSFVRLTFDIHFYKNLRSGHS